MKACQHKIINICQRFIWIKPNVQGSTKTIIVLIQQKKSNYFTFKWLAILVIISHKLTHY